MILAPLALLLLSTTPPETATLLHTHSPAPAAVAAPHVSLREAAIVAARRSGPRLEQTSILRAGPRRLSYRTHRRAVAIALGITGGFVGGLLVGPAMSNRECMSPLWLVMSTSAAGGAAGWALTR